MTDNKASSSGDRWSRARSRIATYRHSQESNYSLEIAFTAALIIVGLIVGNTKLSNSSKFAVGVYLGILEIVFVSFRLIDRRITALARDYLTVIPRDRLSRVLYQHLDSQRALLLDRATRLADHLTCELEKHEMYSELIGLTEIVTEYYGGSGLATIWAISSINIEDFDDEPLAEAYLEANRRAVAEGVNVCRLFLLDDRQIKDRQVTSLMRKHHDALTEHGTSTGSGVRWLLKADVPRSDQTQDFALFANDALITQSISGDRGELTHDQDRTKRAAALFHRLWKRKNAHPVSELHGVRT